MTKALKKHRRLNHGLVMNCAFYWPASSMVFTRDKAVTDATASSCRAKNVSTLERISFDFESSRHKKRSRCPFKSQIWKTSRKGKAKHFFFHPVKCMKHGADMRTDELRETSHIAREKNPGQSKFRGTEIRNLLYRWVAWEKHNASWLTLLGFDSCSWILWKFIWKI